MADFGTSPQRVRLGQALRRLRLAAGHSGEELARRGGWSQSKVSRLELGQGLFRPSEVERWLQLTGATEAERASVVALAEALSTEVTRWRRAEMLGLARLQMDIARVEATSRLIQTYQPLAVPGLLQTAEYTRRLMLLVYPDGRPDIQAAVSARQARQEILYDPSRRLEFIVAEAALRWHVGADAMWGQIDRMLPLATQPQIVIGLLPSAAAMSTWNAHGFSIFSEREDEPPIVDVEVLHSGLTVTDPDDVEAYRAAFERLRQAALWGADAERALRATQAAL